MMVVCHLVSPWTSLHLFNSIPRQCVFISSYSKVPDSKWLMYFYPLDNYMVDIYTTFVEIFSKIFNTHKIH